MLLTDENFDKVERLQAFAEQRGHSLGALAIAARRVDRLAPAPAS